MAEINVLVVAEHDNEALKPATLNAVAAGAPTRLVHR